MEQLLHYVWKHKIFPLRELKTTDGFVVEVIDTGLQNTDAGPDFFNAKIKIDGALWVGNIEIHSASSDWYEHGHHTDRTYDSVVLHIAGKVNKEVYRTNGEQIPQVQLTCPEHIYRNYEELNRISGYPCCHKILKKLSKLTLHSWMSALQTERFAQKTERVFQRLESCNGNWEDAFFITLARNFGFGVNGDAFETWANLLSFRALDKHRDNLPQLEAAFFGQAGLLDEPIVDDYYQKLQREFAFLKNKFQLEIMDVSLWRFLRLRPTNFPHVRLAQLAFLYYQERALFSRVIAATTIKELKKILASRTSDYWETHFHFHYGSSRRLKSLSNFSLELVLINTVIPFLYAYGKHKGQDSLCERAAHFLEEIKPENNRIIRMWDEVGLQVNNASDSQALIQLKNEYCDKKKCLYCRIGFEYLKSKKD